MKKTITEWNGQPDSRLQRTSSANSLELHIFNCLKLALVVRRHGLSSRPFRPCPSTLQVPDN